MFRKSREFLDAAAAIAAAVDAGADPADPQVIALLDGIVQEFHPNVIVGTEEADALFARRGLDYINGLGGDDRLIGDNGTSVIVGGDGNDFVSGGAGADGLYGSDGEDELFGNGGRDTLDGGAGNDRLDGGDGRDTLAGGEGDDSLLGGKGRDALDGGAGLDVLEGGDGADVLNGGAGSDTLTGGEGRDTFLFNGDPFDGADVSAAGRQIIGNEDRITDLDFHRDRIALDAEDFGIEGSLHFAAIDATVADVPAGANVIVLLNPDNDNDPATAFLAGTAANQIAGLVEEDGAGFFVYFNTDLQLNRLVYSTNLNDAAADLNIVARMTDLTGQDAIDALADFSAYTFDFV